MIHKLIFMRSFFSTLLHSGKSAAKGQAMARRKPGQRVAFLGFLD